MLTDLSRLTVDLLAEITSTITRCESSVDHPPLVCMCICCSKFLSMCLDSYRAKSVTLCLFHIFPHRTSEGKQMHRFLSSSQAPRRQRTFCSVCGSGLKAREKDAGGCWVMKTAKVWVIIERGSVWRWGRCPPHPGHSTAESSLTLTLLQRSWRSPKA